MLGVMAKLAEHGVHTSDKAYLEQMLESVSNDPDVAYAGVFGSNQEIIVERRFSRLGTTAEMAIAPVAGRMNWMSGVRLSQGVS